MSVSIKDSQRVMEWQLTGQHRWELVSRFTSVTQENGSRQVPQSVSASNSRKIDLIDVQII